MNTDIIQLVSERCGGGGREGGRRERWIG